MKIFFSILTVAEAKHFDWLKYSETHSDWLAEFAPVEIWNIFSRVLENIFQYVYNNYFYYMGRGLFSLLSGENMDVT